MLYYILLYNVGIKCLMKRGNMNAMNVIKNVANATNTPLMKIGREMGIADNYVNKTIARGSVPRCDTMARMLNVCNYALCAVPKNKIDNDYMLVID